MSALTSKRAYTSLAVFQAGDAVACAIPLQVISNNFDVLGVPEAIAMRAVQVRQVRRLKLPDAIVLATAMEWGCQLVTRNTKDFPAGDPDIRVPYTLERETLERETLERETL